MRASKYDKGNSVGRGRGNIFKASDRSFICSGYFLIKVTEKAGIQDISLTLFTYTEGLSASQFFQTLGSDQLFMIVLDDGRQITTHCRLSDRSIGDVAFVYTGPDGFTESTG